MDAKRFALLRGEVRMIDRALSLDLTDEQREMPQKNLPKLIDSIAEELSETGETIQNVEAIENCLGLDHSEEESLVSRLDVIAETLLDDDVIDNSTLKDVVDLIDIVRQAPDADLRKKLDELSFRLSRIAASPAPVESVYQEAHSFVACA